MMSFDFTYDKQGCLYGIVVYHDDTYTFMHVEDLETMYTLYYSYYLSEVLRNEFEQTEISVSFEEFLEDIDQEVLNRIIKTRKP